MSLPSTGRSCCGLYGCANDSGSTCTGQPAPTAAAVLLRSLVAQGAPCRPGRHPWPLAPSTDCAAPAIAAAAGCNGASCFHQPRAPILSQHCTAPPLHTDHRPSSSSVACPALPLHALAEWQDVELHRGPDAQQLTGAATLIPDQLATVPSPTANRAARACVPGGGPPAYSAGKAGSHNLVCSTGSSSAKFPRSN
jgi:hypothetical protein